MTEGADIVTEDKNDERVSDSSFQQFLTFSVAGEEYGVELMTIREIKGWSVVTSLPDSPEFMKGVIDLRGIIIPIFDLKHRFGIGVTEETEKTVVIIIAVGERLIGVLVDAVSDILNANEDQIKPAPKVESKIDKNFVNGLISVEDKMVVLLNIEALFDEETMESASKASMGVKFDNKSPSKADKADDKDKVEEK